MVNYGAAFRLPFSDVKRLSVLLAFVILALFTPAFFIARMYIELFKASAANDQTLALSTFSVTAFSGINVWTVLSAGIAFIVFGLAALGYSLRIQGHAANGRNVLPAFDNAAGLFTVALKYVLGTIVYLVLFHILYFGTIALFLLPGLFKLFGILLLIPLICSLLFFIYVMPMLVAHFAAQNRFAALFEVRKALKYSFTMAYFIPWLVSFGYNYLISFVAYLAAILLILAFMPLSLMVGVSAGLVLYMLVYSAAFMTVFNLYGQAYYDVRAAEKGKAAVGRLRVARKK